MAATVKQVGWVKVEYMTNINRTHSSEEKINEAKQYRWRLKYEFHDNTLQNLLNRDIIHESK